MKRYADKCGLTLEFAQVFFATLRISDCPYQPQGASPRFLQH